MDTPYEMRARTDCAQLIFSKGKPTLENTGLLDVAPVPVCALFDMLFSLSKSETVETVYTFTLPVVWSHQIGRAISCMMFRSVTYRSASVNRVVFVFTIMGESPWKCFY
jgi:hypothetical protein